jgi:hypothetical protein
LHHKSTQFPPKIPTNPFPIDPQNLDYKNADKITETLFKRQISQSFTVIRLKEYVFLAYDRLGESRCYEIVLMKYKISFGEKEGFRLR